jgi:hypothetical protein
MFAPNMTPAMRETIDTVVSDVVKTNGSYNNLRAKLTVTNAQEMTVEKHILIAVQTSKRQRRV